jgi:hypothetical protein
MSAISLRLAPTGNNQSRNVRWAEDYEMARAMALLGRQHRAACLPRNAGNQHDTMAISGL